jgi:hypothetical protein
LVYAGAGGFLWLLWMPWLIRGLLLVALIAALIVAWRRSSDCNVNGIALRNNQWFLRRGVVETRATCRADYLGRRLVILNVKESAGQRHRLVIFSDAMGVADFRRLRVLLRTASGKKSAGSG